MLSNINDNQVNIDLRVLLPYDIPLSYFIITYNLASQYFSISLNIISYKNSKLHKLPMSLKNYILTIIYDFISPQESLRRHLIKADNIKPFIHPLA